MHKLVAMARLYPVIEETLKAGGSVTLTATGSSMMPMLKHQRDTIILGPAAGPLHLNDVILYRRKSGQFVLHRIVGQESNGDYVLCGDNQFVLEHHIAQRQVIGRLKAFTRKGRHITCSSLLYKAYVCLLPALRRLKRAFAAGRRYMSAMKRRMHRQANGNG